MKPNIAEFNHKQTETEQGICNMLAFALNKYLPEADSKIWHRHPVWFLKDNPVVGYSKLKAGIQLMFWSGADFDEPTLKPGTGKFKDASILYNSISQVDLDDIRRWVEKSKIIQWDYKNIYKRKGRLELLK